MSDVLSAQCECGAAVARAFAGTLVDSEAQARHGVDLRMRVGTRGQKVGTCGSRGFCGAEVAACYTCIHFQPWRDAPHHKMLEWFLAGASAGRRLRREPVRGRGDRSEHSRRTGGDRRVRGPQGRDRAG